MAQSSPYQPLTQDVITEISNSEVPYSGDDEKEICQRLVESLSSEEQEIAACTSYAYWFAQTYHQDQSPADDIRLRMAMREARRHLVKARHNETNALTHLCAGIQYRKKHRLDLFRTLYPVPAPPHGGYPLQHRTSEEEEEIKAKMREHIEEELHSKQVFVVRGADRESRALAIKMKRTSPGTMREAFLTTQLYVVDRAIACTEYLSRGVNEQIVAVMDFDGYSSSTAPPLLTLKETVTCLQDIYPERLKTAIITEPTFWMRGLYNVLYPLMSDDTRGKIQMAYGEGKFQTIRALVAPEQAMTFMLPDGKLTSDIDVRAFLEVVPFHCTYI